MLRGNYVEEVLLPHRAAAQLLFSKWIKMSEGQHVELPFLSFTTLRFIDNKNDLLFTVKYIMIDKKHISYFFL